VKRVSAVLAGLLIGTAGALLPIGSAAPVAAPVARPVASEAPATVVAKTCDQAIPVTLPNTDMETVSFDRSPDGTVFVLGARVYHRMGPYVPDEQRVLMLSLSNLEPTDLAAGTDPRFSGSGSRIAYRAPRPEANARATELIVFDVAAKREVARIEDVARHHSAGGARSSSSGAGMSSGSGPTTASRASSMRRGRSPGSTSRFGTAATANVRSRRSTTSGPAASRLQLRSTWSTRGARRLGP